MKASMRCASSASAAGFGGRRRETCISSAVGGCSASVASTLRRARPGRSPRRSPPDGRRPRSDAAPATRRDGRTRWCQHLPGWPGHRCIAEVGTPTLHTDGQSDDVAPGYLPERFVIFIFCSGGTRQLRRQGRQLYARLDQRRRDVIGSRLLTHRICPTLARGAAARSAGRASCWPAAHAHRVRCRQGRFFVIGEWDAAQETGAILEEVAVRFDNCLLLVDREPPLAAVTLGIAES